MCAPIWLSAEVKPSRDSYTVSWTMDRPVACVSATTSGCCQSVWKPGWTSVSSAMAFSWPPGCQKRMPSSSISKAPPTLRKVFRNVIIERCWAPRT